MCEPARYNFCWLCSGKLMNGAHSHQVIDGADRILHKECASSHTLASDKFAMRHGGKMSDR